MTITEVSTLVGSTVATLVLGVPALWYGWRRISTEIEERGYERARAESYKEESKETIAQLTSELKAKDDRIADLDARLTHATTVEMPRLMRRIDELSEIVLNLSRGQEHEPC